MQASKEFEKSGTKFQVSGFTQIPQCGCQGRSGSCSGAKQSSPSLGEQTTSGTNGQWPQTPPLLSAWRGQLGYNMLGNNKNTSAITD